MQMAYCAARKQVQPPDPLARRWPRSCHLAPLAWRGRDPCPCARIPGEGRRALAHRRVGQSQEAPPHPIPGERREGRSRQAAVPVATAMYGGPLTQREEEAQLRLDFAAFAQRCFRELNPLTPFAMNWHVEVMAAKLAAVHQGKIRRLIINVPPRYLKSLLGSIAFPPARHAGQDRFLAAEVREGRTVCRGQAPGGAVCQ
jgi:hypothetical protein